MYTIFSFPRNLYLPFSAILTTSPDIEAQLKFIILCKRTLFSVNFFIRRTRLGKSGETPIMMRISVDGRYTEYNNMTEWVDKKSQARIDMGLSSGNEEQLLNKAIEAEAKRAEQKRRKRQKLLKSTPYALSEGVATLMDKYYLDALIGLVPSVGDVLSSIFMMPQLYLALFEIRSIPLTLAVLLNIIIDACLGIIPFWIGNIIDIFNRAYIKNMRLINGFVNDDPEVIEEVNQKALISAVLIVVFIGIIYLLINAVAELISWIGSWF